MQIAEHETFATRPRSTCWMACSWHGVPAYAAEVVRTMLLIQVLLEISQMLIETDEQEADKLIIKTFRERVDVKSIVTAKPNPPRVVPVGDDSVVTQTGRQPMDFTSSGCVKCALRHDRSC